jgi:hypothetical protein
MINPTGNKQAGSSTTPVCCHSFDTVGHVIAVSAVLVMVVGEATCSELCKRMHILYAWKDDAQFHMSVYGGVGW